MNSYICEADDGEDIELLSEKSFIREIKSNNRSNSAFLNSKSLIF